MPIFTITGQISPFLHVQMNQGEKIYAESDAMVSMDSTLDLQGQMKGGFFSALTRRLANGESFFQQHIEASRGPGDILLAPGLPGGIEVLDVGKSQYLLNDGAFLAANDSVDLTVQTQGIGRALLGGTGGFFIMRTAGKGQLAVSGFGDIFTLPVEAGNDVLVDNYHVVAWDSQLNYDISASTIKNGFLGSLVNSVTSGEGIVNRFSGTGNVYICSRNQGGFLQWVSSSLQGVRQ